MKHIRPRRSCLIALLVALPVAPGLAQDPGQEAEEKPSPFPPHEEIELDKPTLEEINPFAEENDPQAEMKELFLRVERRLMQMDTLLIDAGAGDTSRLDELEAAGMDELLDAAPQMPSEGSGGEGSSSPSTGSSASGGSSSPGGVGGMLRRVRSEGEAVRSDIDRILEIAEQNGGSCSNPGDGQSPLDNRPQDKTQKSQSPDKPQEQESDSDDPQGNEESDSDPKQQPGSQSPKIETETPPGFVDDRDQWGELPVHVRDVFRAEGGKGMPAQYRDWIDSYYRRLNSRSGD